MKKRSNFKRINNNNKFFYCSKSFVQISCLSMDFGLCQKVANYIMRPPRTRYELEDLGPKTFHHRSRVYERVDFKVQNSRQLKVQCSLFKQKHTLADRETVIFLHANSSSRLAAKNYLGDLLPFFNVACMDCAGSGNSQGNFVTLGYYEKEDVRALIEFLKSEYLFTKFILWGRSMGAVTSLLYAAKYQDVKAVVSDNAFSDLEQTCKQLKDTHLSIFPDFLLQTLLESTQQYIDENMNRTQNLNFNLKLLKPKNCINKIKCPVFYIYSQNDRIVNNRHTKTLYELSNYPKRIMSVKGDHNGVRDADIKGKVIDYLLELMLKNINITQSKVKHKNSDIQTREQENEVVFQSPFNQNLRQSYLGKSGKKRISTELNESQNYSRRFSFKVEKREKQYPVSQTCVKYSKNIGSEVLDSELKEDDYKIETMQFSKGKSSCFDSCLPGRRRKKIFSNR